MTDDDRIAELRAAADRDEVEARIIERQLGPEFRYELGVERPPSTGNTPLDHAEWAAELSARRLEWLRSRWFATQERREWRALAARDRLLGLDRFLSPGLGVDDLIDAARSVPQAALELNTQRVERVKAGREAAKREVAARIKANS